MSRDKPPVVDAEFEVVSEPVQPPRKPRWWEYRPYLIIDWRTALFAGAFGLLSAIYHYLSQR